MGKYAVFGYLTIGCFKEVEASSQAEARQKAEQLAIPGLCHQCASSGDRDDDSWVLNEFDDVPEDCIQSIEPPTPGADDDGDRGEP